MDYFLIILLACVCFALGVGLSSSIYKTQEQKNLERSMAYIDSTYLFNSGITSIAVTLPFSPTI